MSATGALAVPPAVAPTTPRIPVKVPLRLAWLLARPSAGGLSAAALPVTAFGLVTALLLTVVAGGLSFFQWQDETGQLYLALAAIATALLVVPLVSLGGSAARLSARRRDERLATLRLLGAPASTVAVMTVAESALLAAVGALAGIIGHLLLIPVVQLIPFRGQALGGSVWMGPGPIALVALGVVLLAAVSAVLGLRTIVVSPLGVRTRRHAPRIHWLRAVIGIAVIAVVVTVLSTIGGVEDFATVVVVLGVGFAGALGVLDLVGPWIIGVLARRQVRSARTPERLLAARQILDSPKGAWRQVSGVAMTCFVAVFGGTGAALMNSAGPLEGSERFLGDDVRTGVLITIVASFLMVACSVGVNQSSLLLDRRDLYVSLDRLGMPVPTMNAARTRAVLFPLMVVSVGSALTAVVVVLPLAGLALIFAPLSVAVIIACLAGGVGLVALGLRATRPVLTHVLRTPAAAL
ncbi:FtsX-like permease family protein [Arthrobacter sp. MDT1-48-3]